MIYQLKRALIVYTPIDRETKISPIGFITQNEDETNPNRPKDTLPTPFIEIYRFIVFHLYFILSLY